jgi:hypothetical protein
MSGKGGASGRRKARPSKTRALLRRMPFELKPVDRRKRPDLQVMSELRAPARSVF